MIPFHEQQKGFTLPLVYIFNPGVPAENEGFLSN